MRHGCAVVLGAVLTVFTFETGVHPAHHLSREATAEQAVGSKTTAGEPPTAAGDATTTSCIDGDQSAAKQTRHSGRVVTVDPATQTLTFEEMGPWAPHQSALVKRTIKLAPGAAVGLVSRAKEKDLKGWLGGFVESPTGLSDLKPGDWVTVVVERDPEPRAVSVDAVRPTTSSEPPRK